MYGKIELFPVLFFHYKINDWENKKKILLDLKQKSTLTKDPFNLLLTDFYHEEKYNDKIENLLYEELQTFKQDIGLNNDFKISDAWFQEYKMLMNQGVHSHGAYGYTAVIYIKFNKNIHPYTSFFSDNLHFLDGAVQSFEPDVQEGSLILFPSNLKHYAQPNTTNSEKIIMSFNIEWKK